MFTAGLVLFYSTGTKTAYTAQTNVIPSTATGFQVALNTVTSGTTVSGTGLVLPVIGVTNIEFDSLFAIIQTNLTTSTLTVTPVWQQSDDNTNWRTITPMNGAAYVQWPPTGTGSLVNTCEEQAFAGCNPAARYIRIAFTVGGTTGASGDNIVASYRWRKRFVAPIG